ncbi:thiol reductant ABC exporter subunit CydD [Microbacterium sp. ET2]|uniref:thiol reductant ABC exporter subunit CydD n=1 Tax=Microbacterium albipurpureum TaxID=3050384 RepID=UPI00259D1724|nr:thiol reductant ABC exporter subunit CydD [Microbacterium sp. ET2 (Ac-2212)]WJL96289.1 thiol reductant ABC exporter subunit CydD [Microbacterium sp. ET2 (Ac-2212)]
MARPVDPRLLRYAAASRPFFALLVLIGLAQAVVVVAFAWLLTQAIVGAIDGMPPAELAGILTALVVVVALRAALAWAREAAATRAAARAQSELRAAVLTAVDRLGPGWLSGRNTARLAVTAGRGLEAMEAYFGRYLPQLVLTAVATPLLVAVMWWQDWISALTVALTLPLIPLFMVLIGLATRGVQKRQWDTLGRLAARFADTVRGLGTLKLYQRQERAVASIGETTARYRRETMTVLRVSFLSGFALEFLASIAVAIVAVSIGFRLLDGALPLAVGLFVLLLAPEAYLPLRQVGVQFHAAAEGVAATEEVFAVLDAAGGETRSGDDGRDGPDAAGQGLSAGQRLSAGMPGLVVEDLRVRRGDVLLDAIDLTAAPGTVTLLTGPSGAGKSSLFAALRGAAEAEGTATWQGRDVRALSPAQWLAWAGQDAGLLHGSVADNVALGDTAPVEALVRRALLLACADGVSPDLELGVRGAGLSGGQAQRVAVARAFYRLLRDPAGRGACLLALDEPSAALDPGTEERLWRSVRTLADEGSAVLLISHRPSARRIADRMVSMGTESMGAESMGAESTSQEARHAAV